MQKLRVGRINYANLFPIYYTLEKHCDCSQYEFVEGVPSQLNRMLRHGEIDLSPSSSVEYLRNKNLYNIIDGVSISSIGPVGSVFLFSKKPIESLDNELVKLTSQSDTSVALLEIILKRFCNLNCRFAVSSEPESENADAFLMIGDDALRYKAEVKSGRAKGIIVYDLGELWQKNTGLPFVFALWIVRKELYDPLDSRSEIFNKYIKDLNTAKSIALDNLHKIAQYSPLKQFMSEQDIIEYWSNLNYDLADEHKKGLALFERDIS
ncbi:MAG: menaquinone biosynthesis protein [Dissulfurispiraceae bacterium]|jgi:chorismate dehydratase|nr:menaquinone biosynthesis protein [Dissulfurispiraceae bacterium]